MITSVLNFKLQVILTFVATFLVPMTIQNNVVEKIDKDIEEWNLGLLAEVQNRPATKLNAFTTDGCSGGLSEAWSTFSEFAPAFKEKFGNKPPWEPCCVEHDRAYWKGEVDDGYEKRRIADDALRQCVIEYGKKHSKRLSKKFDIEKDKIEQQFVYTGELMYRAVRLGGKPCSLLPWRWGYGWPHCKVSPFPENNTEQ